MSNMNSSRLDSIVRSMSEEGGVCDIVKGLVVLSDSDSLRSGCLTQCSVHERSFVKCTNSRVKLFGHTSKRIRVKFTKKQGDKNEPVHVFVSSDMGLDIPRSVFREWDVSMTYAEAGNEQDFSVWIAGGCVSYKVKLVHSLEL